MADLMLANSTYASGTNDTATTLVNNVSLTDAQQMNGVASACIAVETILGSGTSLKGSVSDLATRLAVQVGADGIINPVGTISMYGGASAPTGWLLCDGSAVSRTTYADLFAVIGTTYGAGNGTTTFNVPTATGRGPVGVGTGAGGGSSGTGVPTGGSALTARSRGQWYGKETHTLSTAELPSHTHSINVDTVGVTGSTAVLGSNNAADISLSGQMTSSGGGGAHTIVDPKFVVNFIIKY